MSVNKTTLVIDGDHLCHRHLYQPGLRKLSNSQGIPTGLVMGVLDQLNFMHLSTVNAIESIYFVMGGGSCKWRREIYPEYKFKSEEDRAAFKTVQPGDNFSSAEILTYARKILKEFLPALGVKYVEYPNYEADEIGYFICYRLNMIGKDIMAISDDFDWTQLCLHIGCTVNRAIKDDYVSPSSFKAQFGYPLEGVILYQALIGGHDNLPKPLNGFGKKGIISMLNELKDFSPMGVREWALSQKPGSKKHKLADPEVQEILKMNIELVDFTQAPLTEGIKTYIDNHIKNKRRADPSKINKLMDKYEFNKLRENLQLVNFLKLR